MRALLIGLGVAVVLSAAPAQATELANCSRTEASGERTLCHELVVPAPLGEVWALWTTSEGLSSWAAPVAAIDPRVGGMFESSYDAAARIGDAGNIRNRVIAILPQRLLAIQVAEAPPNFPHADEVRQLATLVELDAAGERATRVRVTMLGYRGGEAFETLYRHFAQGNAWTLHKLHARVTNGPIDWRAVAQQRRGN